MIGADAEFIVQRCILAEPDEFDEEEAASRERRGVVMGAVQSGKTASMLAVIAKSLDAGVDAVVVLGGTRTALWLQTWERVLGQLDTLEAKNRRRVMLPTVDPTGMTNGAAGPSLYVLNPNQVTRALDLNRPIIVVAMKQVAHLERVARTLREVVYPAVQRVGRPYHLLVVDDEADDSSIDESGPHHRSQLSGAPGSAPHRRLVGVAAAPGDPRHSGETYQPPTSPTRRRPRRTFCRTRATRLRPRTLWCACVLRERRATRTGGSPDSESPKELPVGTRAATSTTRRSRLYPCAPPSTNCPRKNNSRTQVRGSWLPAAFGWCEQVEPRRPPPRSSAIRDCSRGKGGQRTGDVDVGAPVCGNGGPFQHGPPAARMVRRTWSGRRRGPCIRR